MIDQCLDIITHIYNGCYLGCCLVGLMDKEGRASDLNATMLMHFFPRKILQLWYHIPLIFLVVALFRKSIGDTSSCVSEPHATHIEYIFSSLPIFLLCFDKCSYSMWHKRRRRRKGVPKISAKQLKNQNFFVPEKFLFFLYGKINDSGRLNLDSLRP